MKTIETFTGLTREEIGKILKDKEIILEWIVKNNINTVDGVGRVMAEYYTDKNNLMEHVKKNKMLED